MVHKNARAVNGSLAGGAWETFTTERPLLADYMPGGSGCAASLPTTVVHSRIFHAVTNPPVTYGSVFAKASTGSLVGVEKNNAAPSTGSAKAPARTSSPRAMD